MRLSQHLSQRINFVIIGISILVWILLLINPGHIMTIEHCHVSASGPSTASLQMLLEMNPFSSQLIGWGMMVVAMMLPKLIIPIKEIYIQSFKRYRFLLSLLFVFGYLSVWMVVGVFMVAVIIGFNLWMPMSNLPALGVLIAAVLWQFSPIKQQFLNKGHDHWSLAAYGWKANKDALCYGVMHGIWCVGSGWAIMLFPMLLSKGHDLAMIVVTFIMISEHLEHPRFPKWNLNLRLRLFKIFIAQTKIKLSGLKLINQNFK